MDHIEACCIFDSSQYTGVPDAEPCEKTIDVPEIIRALTPSMPRVGKMKPRAFWKKGSVKPAV